MGEACVASVCSGSLGCPAAGASSLAGPHQQYGFCWYLGVGGAICDTVCTEMAGGSNLAVAAETAWADNCSAPDTDDISRWFFDNGNPAGWFAAAATGYHTLGYGYLGSAYYGKCASGGNNNAGTYPGETNNDGTRTNVCACAQ